MGRWQQRKNTEVQLPDASSMPTSRMNAPGPQEASSATRYQQINETTRRQRTHVLSRSQELRKSLRTEAGHTRMSWQREIREAEDFLRADRRLETIVYAYSSYSTTAEALKKMMSTQSSSWRRQIYYYWMKHGPQKAIGGLNYNLTHTLPLRWVLTWRRIMPGGGGGPKLNGSMGVTFTTSP